MTEVDRYIDSLDSNKSERASILVSFMGQEYPDIEEAFENKRPAYKTDGE